MASTLQTMRRYRLKNKAKLRLQMLEWLKKNKEHVAAYKKKYESSPEVKKRRREGYQSPARRAHRAEYLKRPEVHARVLSLQRLRSRKEYCTPAQALRKRISSKIRLSLGTKKNNNSWRKFVDFDIDELRSHLEKQFLRGMNWENIDQWHIDHIIPIAELRNNVRACWALANLRPVWASTNRAKGSKRLFLI